MAHAERSCWEEGEGASCPLTCEKGWMRVGGVPSELPRPLGSPARLSYLMWTSRSGFRQLTLALLVVLVPVLGPVASGPCDDVGACLAQKMSLNRLNPLPFKCAALLCASACLRRCFPLACLLSGDASSALPQANPRETLRPSRGNPLLWCLPLT